MRHLIRKHLENKDLLGSTTTVWRYMSRKGCKPLRKKKRPLLNNKQQKIRSTFARKYRKVAADNGKSFSLAMSENQQWCKKNLPKFT